MVQNAHQHLRVKKVNYTNDNIRQIEFTSKRKRKMKKPGLLFIALIVVLSLACGGQSLIPALPSFPPTPGTSNVPTGSSPMSGDWNASPDFGRLAFTVDPDGRNVTTAVISMKGWKCGGTILSTGLQSLSQWPISDGEFGGNVNLNGNFHTMTIIGKYDKAKKQFVGTWEEDAHGTTCSGEWESIPRK
jgi:hypothetical protein